MTELQEGEKAPDFAAKDQTGKTVSLANYLGREVVLYFYPEDDTPTCTKEACNFRDNYRYLLAKGFQVVGVSPDDPKSHVKFKKKYKLPFPLIADTDRSIIESYGLWGEKMMFGRTYMGTFRKTFIIGTDGLIKKIIHKVDSENAAQQVLEVMGRA